MKKILLVIPILATVLLPLQGYADTNPNEKSDLPLATLIGAGVLAAGGAVAVALAGHHGNSDNVQPGPKPTPPSPTGPVCDDTCLNKVVTAMANYKQAHNIPNMHLIFRTANGASSYHYNTEINVNDSNEDDRHHFLSGSLSRLIAAAVVLNSKVKLDDTVGKYFSNIYPAWSNVTVKQLLAMTSGVPNYATTGKYWNALFTDPAQLWQAADLVNLVNKTTLDFSPGANWENSNTNDALLEMIYDQAVGGSATMEQQMKANLLALGAIESVYDTTMAASSLQLLISKDHYRGNDTAHTDFNFQTLSPSALRTSGGVITSSDNFNQLFWELLHNTSTSDVVNTITSNMVCSGLLTHSCNPGTQIGADSTDVAYNAGVYRFGLNQLGLANSDKIYFVDGSTPGSTIVNYYYRNDAKNYDFLVTFAGNVGSEQNFPAYSDLYKQILQVVSNQAS